MNYFITGTDTDCGKTYVTSLLIKAARRLGKDVIGAKPFCCGTRDDVEILAEASGCVEPLDAINPVWRNTPAAPLACEMLGEPTTNIPRALEAIRKLAAKHAGILCEGAGGWLVPVTADHTTADFAAELGWPVIVVAQNKLGVLNHTLLTVENIRARGLRMAGIILNNSRKTEDVVTGLNEAILEKWTGIPLLAEISPGASEIQAPKGLF